MPNEKNGRKRHQIVVKTVGANTPYCRVIFPLECCVNWYSSKTGHSAYFGAVYGYRWSEMLAIFMYDGIEHSEYMRVF